GKRTLLIEKFSLGHSNGSSHGKSRITRYAHAEPEYIPLITDSYAEIEKLETKRGEQLIIKTGGVMLGSTKKMGKLAKTMRDSAIPHEELMASEVGTRFPHLTYGDDNYTALIDPQAGVILADKWMHAFQDEFRKAGGIVADSTTVNSFNEKADDVTLKTTQGDFSASKVVVAVGSWINKLLPTFPVKGTPELVAVCYWAPKDPADLARITPATYPIHIATEPDGTTFFSMPDVDFKGTVKFLLSGGQVLEDTDKAVQQYDEKFVERVRSHIERHTPFLDYVNGPVRVDRCKYTMSSDHHYVVDYLPGSSKIVVAGCMSGSGFKNAPGLGRALAQLVSGEKPHADLSFFSLKRF
ncbi:hypothetical protein PFISCL1PPCAC_13494, partial [Pristionchus fissidentatus]